MIIHKGKLARYMPFTVDGVQLERVARYKYLGIWLTSTMSFYVHVQYITAKTRSKIGFLWRMLNIRRLPFNLAMRVFECYLKPILTYGIQIWWHDLNKNSRNTINALFTKFLKSWMGIPAASLNSFTYHITNTMPLVYKLNVDYKNALQKVYLPHLTYCIPQLEDMRNNKFTYDLASITNIPSYMWCTRTIENLPNNHKYRKKIAVDIFGWNHSNYCSTGKFHVPYLHQNANSQRYDFSHDNGYPRKYCKCIFCGENEIGYNHEYKCEKYNDND